MTEEKPAARGKRRALGRGLDALMPAAIPAEAKAGTLEIEVDKISPNPEQPRQRFEKSRLEELAASIREHGVVQPVVVSEVGEGQYQLVVGERRWRAARLAGLARIPAVVKDATDRQNLEVALIENVQRADLNPLEEAQAYQRLVQDFGMSQADVGRQAGKSRVAVTNTLRLLLLPEAAKKALVEGAITEGHARALLSVTSKPTQLAILDRIQRDDLTVRQTEEIVRRLTEGRTPSRVKERSADIEALESEMQRALGTRVSVRRSRKGGRIVIEYYSDEDFQSLYERLVREA